MTLMKQQQTQNYHHFTIETLAEGVYAAMASPEGAADCNAGIVDLGDRTLIFDTFSTISAARELREAAERLTGRQAAYVINSHSHPDHVQGNVVFADHAVLVSSALTRATLVEEGVFRLEEMKGQRVEAADAVRKQWAEATSAGEKERLQAMLQGFDDYFAGYPTPDDLRLPTLTYESGMTFHGSRRSVQLLTFGGAHSPCDAVLWLPEEKILFAADLLLPAGNQVVTLGTPENWLPILDQVETLGAEVIVPGHFHVAPAEEAFAWARHYLTHIFQLADEAIAAGETVECVERMEVPNGCGPLWFRKNMRFLLERR